IKMREKGYLRVAVILVMAIAVTTIVFSAKNTTAAEFIVDDDGPAHYTSIQEAIDAASDGDTIIVKPGVYTESITINKSINLIGDLGAIIRCPATPEDAHIAESVNYREDPPEPYYYEYVIGVFGGTYSSGNDTWWGAGTINVNISGFEIDGNNNGTGTSHRFAGIIWRNAIGSVEECHIHDMYGPSGDGSGEETFGIIVYGDSDITIRNCTIEDFSRGGIGVNGDAGTLPDPVAYVEGNRVYGNGLEDATGWWAENGIQFGYGATGSIVNNEVYDCMVNSTSWAATGIMAVDTDGVWIDDNYVEGCDVGISAVDFPGSLYGSPWDYYHLSNVSITNNTLYGNAWQIDICNDARDITVMYNTISNTGGDCIDVYSYKIWYPSYDIPAPTNVEIHYNNLMDATYDGLWVGPYVTDVVDATYNYWGHTSGPYNETRNPDGQGVSVVGNATFTPWLDSPYPDNDYGYSSETGVIGYYEEDVPAGTMTTVEAFDCSISLNSSVYNTVTIIEYEGNPEGEITSGLMGIGKWYDIQIDNESAVQWPINITIYYTQADLDSAGVTENDLQGISYWDGVIGDWVLFNDTGVNTNNVDGYEGFLWANVWHLTPIAPLSEDNTPPETTKIVGEPKYTRPDGTTLISGDTPITLIATDNGGVNHTYYMIKWYNHTAGEWEVITDGWVEYTGPFTIGQYHSKSCLHNISYYSVDYAGNVETVKWQWEYVDQTPPEVTVIVGDPKYPENVAFPTYVTTSTAIRLYGDDYLNPSPCNTGSWRIYWKINNGSWQNGSVGETINISFNETCEHTLYYYAEDDLGNKGEVQNITFYVDDSPPETGIEFGEPIYEKPYSELVLYENFTTG
ncbi:hypothetical protein DRO91_10500, partial [Candidatus Heimdallarchaeota archaeon]